MSSSGAEAGRSAPSDLARQIALAGHAGDAGTVRSGLQAEDARVREVALSALQRAGDLTAADLEAALSDRDVPVRRRAAELAAAFPGDRPPSLLAALADPEPTVVEMAAWASGERIPAEPSVVDRLAVVAQSHDDALCREAAVAAIGSLEQGGQARLAEAGDPAEPRSPEQGGGLGAVLAATRDRPAVRRRAVLALAAFSGPEVDEALERARQDRDWQVRQAASDISEGAAGRTPAADVNEPSKG